MFRPMVPADAEAVLDVRLASFTDYDRRFGLPEEPLPARATGLARIRHLLETDPGGAWVTEDAEGRIDGAALALVREGLWGLSLLAVAPGRQSEGRGSALLAAARTRGTRARGGLILSSEDPRALRAYWRAGYGLRPLLEAAGPVRTPPPPPLQVRHGRWPEDRELVDAASRAARGAAHGPDIDAMLATGSRLLVHERGGFVLCADTRVLCLAAPDSGAARELLQAALVGMPPGVEVSVEHLDAAQDWAFDVVLEAGLPLRTGGALCVRGDCGPLRPYLPSGAYL